jgi:hypothetical protein
MGRRNSQIFEISISRLAGSSPALRKHRIWGLVPDQPEAPAMKISISIKRTGLDGETGETFLPGRFAKNALRVL